MGSRQPTSWNVIGLESEELKLDGDLAPFKDLARRTVFFFKFLKLAVNTGEQASF
jgi:hypothetical protein